MACKLLSCKLRSNKLLGFLNWYLPSYLGGYNLFCLQDLQIINSTASYLNYAANSNDSFTSRTAFANFEISGIVAELQLLLGERSEIMLEIIRNPSYIDNDHDYKLHHYNISPTLVRNLSWGGLDDIRKLISDSNKLHHPHYLNDLALLHPHRYIQHPQKHIML